MASPAEPLNAPDEGPATHGTWSPDSPHVQRALKFIRSRGGEVKTEELVAWDFKHGRHLFTWDEKAAAAEWRLQEARLFFNRFRTLFNGYRVRAFINMPGDEETGMGRRYMPVETIATTPSLRKLVIEDLTRRMASLAAELKMWDLSPEEQEEVFVRLRQVMGG